MMRMRDGDGEGVGGVGAGDRYSGEEALDHEMDLGLVGAAAADDGLLDQPRGIFADCKPRARGDHQHDTARLGELERGLGVLVDEDFLGRGGVRRVVGKERFELSGEMGQALRERLLRVGLELTVREVSEAIALGADEPVAGRGEAGVKAEDDQPSFSSTSSLTS